MEHGKDCIWKHPECEACPVEVRGLFAAAVNACNSFKHGEVRNNPARLARKMQQLLLAAEDFQPFIDKHFKDV